MAGPQAGARGGAMRADSSASSRSEVKAYLQMGHVECRDSHLRAQGPAGHRNLASV